MSLKQRLEETMKERGYWAHEKPEMKRLSLDAGLGETAVRQILKRDQDNPTVRTVTKLAKALDVSVTWLLEGDHIQPVHRTQISGRIINGMPLNTSGLSGQTVTTPDQLRDPDELVAFLYDENATGTMKGSIVFARPWWDHTGFFGKGSYAIFVEKRDGQKRFHLREIQSDDDGNWFAVSHAVSQTPALPIPVSPSNNTRKGTQEPENANNLSIYAIVEWVQMDYRKR